MVEIFGLDVVMEVVTRSWTGEMWYEGKTEKERR
jgi:hypothetical protein